jgi:type I restriction enzyme, S subunit
MWDEVPIEDALEALVDHRGRTPKKLGAEFVSTGVQVISAQNITENRLDLDATSRFVDPSVADRWMKLPLQPGDVLLSSEAPLGCVAVVAREHGRLCLGQRLFALRGRPGVLDGGYLAAALKVDPVRGRLLARATGTTAQGIRQAELRKVMLPLPPLPEQRAIADVLGALDGKIESNRRLRGAALNMLAASFADIVAGVRGRVALAEVATAVKATTFPANTPDEVFEQFSIPAFDDGGGPDVCVGSSMASGKTVLSGDVVLVSKLNPATKRVWWPERLGIGRAVCSPEFVALAPCPGSAAWIYGCVAFDSVFYAQVLGAISGTTGSRQRVKPSDVLAATVPDAGVSEIAKWDVLARPVLDRNVALLRETRTLTAVRDFLLPKLVSGRIRVPLSGDVEEQVGVATGALA